MKIVKDKLTRFQDTWFPYTGDDEESTATPGNADAHYFAVAKYVTVLRALREERV